jgi:hypothetical protein
MKAPNRKLQAPKKLQTSNSKPFGSAVAAIISFAPL